MPRPFNSPVSDRTRVRPRLASPATDRLVAPLPGRVPRHAPRARPLCPRVRSARAAAAVPAAPVARP